MNFYYKFSNGDNWIRLEGKGKNPSRCKQVRWTCNEGNIDLKIVEEAISDLHPGYGAVVNYSDHPNNIYIQALKMGHLCRYGYSHDSNNFTPFKRSFNLFIKKSEKIIRIKKAERGTHTALVRVKGKKKVFTRKQRVGKKDKEEIKKPKIYKTSTGTLEIVRNEKIGFRLYDESNKRETFISIPKDSIDSFLNNKIYKGKNESINFDIKNDKVIINLKLKFKKDVHVTTNIPKSSWDDIKLKIVDKEVKKSSLHIDNLTEIKSIYEAGISGIEGASHEEETYICQFKDGASAIHKTMMEGDIIGEVGAYETSKIIGWDIVPETIQCNYGKGEGSSQKWIPDGKEPMSGFDEKNEVRLKENHLDDLSKIFILDMITGNFDRHDGNLIIDKNDKVWAIDNEMIGNFNNAQRHIEGLKEFVEKGSGAYLPIFGVLMNNFGDDTKIYQKFEDHIDKNINVVLNKKDEIIKYWSQYEDSKFLNSGAPIKESVKNINFNIGYLEYYQNMEMNK